MTTALQPQAPPQLAQPAYLPPRYALDREGPTNTILGMPVYGFVLYALWTVFAVLTLGNELLIGVFIIWATWTGCRVYDEVKARSKPIRLVREGARSGGGDLLGVSLSQRRSAKPPPALAVGPADG